MGTNLKWSNWYKPINLQIQFPLSVRNVKDKFTLNLRLYQMSAYLTNTFGTFCYLIKRNVLIYTSMGCKLTTWLNGTLPRGKDPIVPNDKHAVNNNKILPPFPNDK